MEVLCNFYYALVILNAFEQKSGCKVNMNKSNAFFVGSSKDNVSQPLSVDGLSWPQNLVTYLGVNIPINNFDNNLLLRENLPGTTREVQILSNLVISRSHVVRKNYKTGYSQNCV